MTVIISKSSSVELLIWRNSFLVLDLGIDIVDGVRCLDVQCGGLACEHLRSWAVILMTMMMMIMIIIKKLLGAAVGPEEFLPCPGTWP